MKNYIKRILLACTLVLGLMLLSGCKQQEDSITALDPALEEVLNQQAENFIQTLTGLTDEEIEQEIEYANDEQMTVLASGLNSWKSAKKDLGAFQSVLSAETVPTEDKGYETTLNLQFEERECSFLYAVDRKNNTTEITFSPDYTMGEMMAQAAGNLIVGMAMVFAVLIFIMLIISLFKYIPQDLGAKKDTKAQEPEPAAEAAEPLMAEGAGNEEEIAAVIAAAIAAYEADQGSGSCGNGLTVRSIRRVSRAQARR